MYQEHDVLAQALECARVDLKDMKVLPEEPSKWYGQLNIDDVLKAEYAFS
jgi:hypothetical protein